MATKQLIELNQMELSNVPVSMYLFAKHEKRCQQLMWTNVDYSETISPMHMAFQFASMEYFDLYQRPTQLHSNHLNWLTPTENRFYSIPMNWWDDDLCYMENDN